MFFLVPVHPSSPRQRAVNGSSRSALTDVLNAELY